MCLGTCVHMNISITENKFKAKHINYGLGTGCTSSVTVSESNSDGLAFTAPAEDLGSVANTHAVWLTKTPVSPSFKRL